MTPVQPGNVWHKPYPNLTAISGDNVVCHKLNNFDDKKQ
jgi:hypothetical protein